ncbi:MAG: CPBP family intramembrane metalloprotease [Candidatus Bathyarchaeota archaeon]|nr:MAG: CPBP family intramembrane metalloprotease [Candidatus Bathyarchaeota archaeon]
MIERSALKTGLTYFTVTLIVFLAAYGFPTEDTTGSLSSVPIFLSIALLAPIYIWHRRYASRTNLGEAVEERSKPSMMLRILILYLLAMAVRIPSVLWFNMPYEKTPLIFLTILTIVLLEKTDSSVFGWKSSNLGASLAKGVIFYLVFGGSMLLTEYLLIYLFIGQTELGAFNTFIFLSVMPFHTLCVGISEEGLFRGYIQTHLEKRFTFRKAILFQALAFGVWHFVWDLSPFNPFGMAIYIASTFFWGLIAGYFYGKSRNLVPLFLTHGLWNSVITGFVMDVAAQHALEGASMSSQVLVAFLPYILSGVLTFLYIKYLVRDD